MLQCDVLVGDNLARQKKKSDVIFLWLLLLFFLFFLILSKFTSLQVL